MLTDFDVVVSGIRLRDLFVGAGEVLDETLAVDVVLNGHTVVPAVTALLAFFQGDAVVFSNVVVRTVRSWTMAVEA